VGSTVSNIQNVIGSPYNDVLTGSKYGNVLVGGGGTDTITGGTGTSVLIGGTGTATIHGNSGNDLIVRGYTNFDDNPTALDAIFAEWDSSDSFAQRKAYIWGPIIGHFNGGYFLFQPTLVQMVLGYRPTFFDVLSNGVPSDTWTTVQGTNWIL
jgi:Ca2+-binding RTX toxin-like protein